MNKIDKSSVEYSNFIIGFNVDKIMPKILPSIKDENVDYVQTVIHNAIHEYVFQRFFDGYNQAIIDGKKYYLKSAQRWIVEQVQKGNLSIRDRNVSNAEFRKYINSL